MILFFPVEVWYHRRWWNQCRQQHPELYKKWTVLVGLEFWWADFRREVLIGDKWPE